ncbi:MAG: hypothetical protein R2729_07140 [Bryobacteraceae bacterium]
MKLTLLLLAAAGLMQAQSAEVRTVGRIAMPTGTDSNVPVVRTDANTYVMFSSEGDPKISRGRTQSRFRNTQDVAILGGANHQPMWIESAWLDERGLLYGWYHYERIIACPDGQMSVPAIGALVSQDRGASFRDLGLVLESWEQENCDAKNGYFAGGHGDFTVIPDRTGKYFYFHFGNYGGDAALQGVAVARMAMADRDQPIGHVWKYFQGDWAEPGIGGRQTPVFPARIDWGQEDTDAFWGPSVHWNTHLEKYVMLLNRSCCWSGWPQEGIYVSYAADLHDPAAWSEPVKIAQIDNWYPQVIGLGPDGSDTLAGRVARLYVRGVSEWQIVFHREAGDDSDSDSTGLDLSSR